MGGVVGGTVHGAWHGRVGGSRARSVMLHEAGTVVRRLGVRAGGQEGRRGRLWREKKEEKSESRGHMTKKTRKGKVVKEARYF